MVDWQTASSRMAISSLIVLLLALVTPTEGRAGPLEKYQIPKASPSLAQQQAPTASIYRDFEAEIRDLPSTEKKHLYDQIRDERATARARNNTAAVQYYDELLRLLSKSM